MTLLIPAFQVVDLVCSSIRQLVNSAIILEANEFMMVISVFCHACVTELFFNVNFSFLFLRDLNEEPKTIRKRVEKDKATEKDWVTFKQNPTRFTQVSALDRFPNYVFRLVNLHCE